MGVKPKIKLTCTNEQFNGIHEEVSKVRSNSKTVKVNKQALINLLLDHSTILGEIEHENEPEEKSV